MALDFVIPSDTPTFTQVQGALAPVWGGTVKKFDGSALDITGATFSGALLDIERNAKVTLAGSYSIVTAASGIFAYAQVAADVVTPGVYLWETVITISSKPYKPWVLVTILPGVA